MDIEYQIERRAMRAVYRILSPHPSSAPFISGDSFRALADHRYEDKGVCDPAAINAGDVVFVATSHLESFSSKYLPYIKAPFILITHNGDGNIDERRAQLADDRRIIRWFAQNVAFAHPKIQPIPIGLENLHYYDYGIIGDFRRLQGKHTERKARILYGFTVGTNIAEREPALRALKAAKAAEELERVNSREYRKRLAEYCFVASPPGNGLDCHRTWETLYLGVIPIVKRSPIFDLLPGFPGIIIDKWSQILDYDERWLSERYYELSKLLGRCEWLWMDYWVRQIDQAKLIVI